MLFERDWSLCEFQKEPMDGDGTISHAIERLFPYVAQDAGYKTCMIMNDVFVGRYLGKIDYLMYWLWNSAEEEFGICYPYQINNIEMEKERFESFFEENDKVYVYGAGKLGRSFYRYLTKIIKKVPIGFVDKNKNGQDLFELPIVSLNEIEEKKGIGIIIAVGDNLLEEIVNELKKKDINSFIFYKMVIKK